MSITFSSLPNSDPEHWYQEFDFGDIVQCKENKFAEMDKAKQPKSEVVTIEMLENPVFLSSLANKLKKVA